MADETGTVTTRSDAPSADESLFGDAAEGTSVAAADEQQDVKEETAEAPEGSEDAGEQPGPLQDLKVVLSIKEGRAIIGVQRPSSDPHIESFDDTDLAGVTQEVPAVIERAKARWEHAPKNPAFERPAPPARRQNRRGQGSAQTGAADAGTEQQQPEPPRLF